MSLLPVHIFSKGATFGVMPGNQANLRLELEISAFFLFSNLRKRQIALYSPGWSVSWLVGWLVGRLTSPLILSTVGALVVITV